ncbi:hypothetical protein GUITHDRAFT_99972 [Guillardia theta CCMP2712]|uniref:Uncharacterized protein n=1 Tax=Guillardia theta (strain CCMP2712) TaxID=905079 RepID=L1K0X7_GUITC|nr:hypothetical protein GUITHDRAFT_99972 [Guillardia theta CCMP2712]EKX54491.1 hypothetical protein GUITHDRAFT_99972 [Guillardia theta CCMP2712]|eukprot:XP_005841471.1 hypothetical protein GUITHDRAFT_99972 [Guillardia theta CCMP2712]
MDYENAAMERAIRDSKRSFEREKEYRKQRDAQFLDDFKRAVLLEGGHVSQLSSQPVDTQVIIDTSNPQGERVRLKGQQSTRLQAMMKAFTMDDSSHDNQAYLDGGNDDEDDEDDEWDPIDIVDDLESDGDSEEDDSMARRRASDLPAPRSRDEERNQLARALRESKRPPSLVSSSRSLRHSRRQDVDDVVIEDADPAPMVTRKLVMQDADPTPRARPILPPPKKRVEGLQDARPRHAGKTREVDDEQLDKDRDRYFAGIMARRQAKVQSLLNALRLDV